MIAWKARWGYGPDHSGNMKKQYYDLINFLDDTFFAFPTKLDIPVDYTNLSYNFSTSTRAPYLINETQAVSIPNVFLNAMGDEYYYISAIPGYGSMNRFFSFNAFESIYSLCKNTITELRTAPSDLRGAYCEIKALDLLMMCTAGNPSTLYMWRLSSISESSSQVLYFKQYGPELIDGSTISFMAYLGGNVNIESLLDYHNYKNVSVLLSNGSGSFSGGGYYCTQQTSDDNGEYSFTRFLSAFFSSYSPPDYSDDPYNPVDPSGPGGGDGTFDDESDLIPVPPLPTLSASNTGFTRIYNPTLSQVQDLARYLWTEPTVIETIWNKIKTFFENPMDAIIGFNLVPVTVPSSGVETLKIIFIDTGVSMNVASNQFVDVDCGTLEIKEYYGSALDYSPNTKIMVYLPYIGTVTVDVDEVMGRTLQVKYRVDICSGSCVAYILVDGNAIYQYSGHCAITIPFSAADFTSYVNAAISVAKLAGAAIMGGSGIGATEAVVEATQKTSDTDYSYSSRGKQKPVSTHETVETTSSTKTS